eukprot:scaffold8859_cov116-Skeletonema_dohrnii-CCMP3373.AAC.5
MKLIYVALVVLSQFGRAISSSTDCKETCKGIRHELLSETHTCSPALTINPTPAVYKSCQNGKKAAFDKACVKLCSNEETTSMASLASDACRASKGRGPSERWCRIGFSSILKKLESYTFPVSESVVGDEKSQESQDQDSPKEVVSPEVIHQAEVEAKSVESAIPTIDSVKEPEDAGPEVELVEQEVIDENIVTKEAAVDEEETVQGQEAEAVVDNVDENEL